jgi:7-carboxy-7-deazaguanine synthase
MLLVNEIFYSIQGESTFAGERCSFVRLTGCNLRCSYCDTTYAFSKGIHLSIDDICAQLSTYHCNLVEITGGEPLLQSDTPALCCRLLESGYTVLVETNGSQDISLLPMGCIRIVDVKCPGSNTGDSFNMKNLNSLTSTDQLKFVISNIDDFEWASRLIAHHLLSSFFTVIFSPNTLSCSPRELANWIIENNTPVRLGLQIHTIIWGSNAQGH